MNDNALRYPNAGDELVEVNPDKTKYDELIDEYAEQSVKEAEWIQNTFLPQRSETTMTQQKLFAFVWDLDHMDRDVTDMQVLKAWEKGPSPGIYGEEDDELYEVERLTPDELAERINDSDCAFGQCYVRFIYTDK